MRAPSSSTFTQETATGREKHHAREQGRSALDQGVRSLDQGRDRSLRLSVREALTGPGADFMSTSSLGANKPIEDIEPTLLAATKSALDELVWWARPFADDKAELARQMRNQALIFLLRLRMSAL